MRPPRGFTLIELGVVLSVSALLAATLLPDLVEGARVQAAERAALDISYLHDAARWYYSQTTAYTSGATGLIPNTWPGQPSSQRCELPPGTDPVPLLIQNGFLAMRPQNPWGLPYEFGIAGNLAMTNSGCMFDVQTDVPAEVARALESLLPMSQCNRGSCRNGPTTPPGFVRCCSAALQPGVAIAPACNLTQALKFESGVAKCVGLP